jgi:hypothetical protein
MNEISGQTRSWTGYKEICGQTTQSLSPYDGKTLQPQARCSIMSSKSLTIYARQVFGLNDCLKKKHVYLRFFACAGKPLNRMNDELSSESRLT